MASGRLPRPAFAIDPDQRLAPDDELDLVRLGADLGYVAAWTPSRADAVAFERCRRWHGASGLAVGISAVPASGRPAAFYAEQARRTWEGTGGAFTLVVGSGSMEHPAVGMRAYLAELRELVPADLPLYLAALGPRMLRLAGEVADGVSLNWCTAAQVAASRDVVATAAREAGRRMPSVVEYIRTAVDPDSDPARSALGRALERYAFGPDGYRRHFERMGFGDELGSLEAEGRTAGGRANLSSDLLSAVGAWGTPGAVRDRFASLAAGLDMPIVRVIAARPGDAASARRVLEECAPGR